MPMNASTPANPGRIALCSECDWVMQIPPRKLGEAAHCPRCHHHVVDAPQRDLQRPLAWALATLIMLGLVFAFDFLSFSTQGVGHTMAFTDAAVSLAGYHYLSLAVLLVLTTVGFPALYLCTLVYLFAVARYRTDKRLAINLARRIRPLEPWMMSDVFIVGVLVSLVKIVTLADIHIGPSFVAFCIYAAMLLRTLTLVDWTSLWDRLAPVATHTSHIATGCTGASQQLVVCRGCDAPFRISRRAHCPRCGRRHWRYKLDRLQLTWALLVTATILYIPANLYPIMFTTSLGTTEPQTIIGGVVHLAQSGSWPIALVIFVASVIVPISKVVALAWLCLAARHGWHHDSRAQMRLYRVTEKIGRWSMIDVFVVAILAALVQAGALMAIQPGPAALSFAGVVLITMVAALSFDSRRLWDDHFYSEPS